MEEEQTTNITKKNKMLIIGLIVIAAVVAVVTVFIYVSGSKDRKLKETLHLAEQYLNELDYEKAIAAYEDAINIDQKCIDAYIGIADIYVVMSDEAESNSDYENAIKNCDSGLENLNRALNSELNDSETITAKIDEITLKKEELQKKLDNQLAEGQKKHEEEQKAKEEEEKKTKLLSNDSDLSSVKVGDKIYFGHKDSFSLSWTVLEVQNDKVLLLADGITKCEAQNIDKNLDFERHFYDEEWEKILEIQIEDTVNSVPNQFNGEIITDQHGVWFVEGKGNGAVEFSGSGNPDYLCIDKYSQELLESKIDRQKVKVFILSYDEANKYTVNDCVLRNIVHCKYDGYKIAYNIDYKQKLEAEGYEYNSMYGYHIASGEGDSYACIDSDGNLYVPTKTDKVKIRPAMWVKIN